jgi:hypothetical protein
LIRCVDVAALGYQIFILNFQNKMGIYARMLEMACNACARSKFIIIGAQYVIWKRLQKPSLWKRLFKNYREYCALMQINCERNAEKFMNEKCPECPNVEK